MASHNIRTAAYLCNVRPQAAMEESGSLFKQIMMQDRLTPRGHQMASTCGSGKAIMHRDWHQRSNNSEVIVGQASECIHTHKGACQPVLLTYGIVVR